MNEEALKDAHGLFVNTGYKGSIEDFSALINSNQEALADAHSLFVETGYSGSIDDFSALVGVKKKESAVSEGGVEGSSPSESQSRSVRSIEDRFLEEVTKVYDQLPSAQKKLVDLKLRKADNDRKIAQDLSLSPDPFTPPIPSEGEEPTERQARNRAAIDAIEAAPDLDRKIESLQGYIAFDETAHARGIDPTFPEYFDARSRLKSVEEAARENGQDLISYVQDNPEARDVVNAFDTEKVRAERGMLDTYLDYIRQTEGDGRVDDITRSVVKLMPQIRDRAREGQAGYAGLYNYLEENIDNLTQAGMSTRIDIDRKLRGELDYESMGSQAQLSEIRKMSELVVGANAFYANYMNQRAIDLNERVRTLSEENTEALETIDRSVEQIEQITSRLSDLEASNPKVFGDRRKTAAALNEQSKQLAKEMMEVEGLYKRLQSNPEDMALSDAYAAKAESYNSKRDAFNRMLQSFRREGEGVVAEHGRLISDYERLVGDIEDAKGKLGEDFFAMADEVNRMAANYEAFADDSMASTNIYGLWQTLSKTHQTRRLEEAKNTTWGAIREYLVMPFVEPIYNTLEGIAVNVPNITADLIYGDDRGYSPLRNFYETLQENRELGAVQLPQVAATGFITRDDDGEIPWQAGWASATSQGLGSVATFFTGGGLGAKAATKLLPRLAPKAATKFGSKVGITATGFYQMANGLYQESLGVGLDTRDAAAISLSMALALGYTETLVNDYTTYAPWEQGFKNQMFKSMAENFGKKGWWKPSMTANAAMVAWGGLGEAKEEALAELAEGVMKFGINLAYGEDLYDLPDATDVVEASLVGFVTGGITKGAGIAASQIHPQYASTFLDVIDDAERLQAVTEQLSKTMTTEEFTNFQRLVNTYKGALDGYDVDAMDDVQKLTVADAVVNIAQMEEQIKRSPTGDVLEQLLRPKIDAEKAKILEVLISNEDIDVAESTPEGRLASEVVSEQRAEVESQEAAAFAREVEQTNAEFDTYMTEAAGNEFLTTEVSNALGAIERNESLEDTQADNAINAIFSEIDRVNESNLSEATKERITSALFDIAEQIDGYDFRAKIATVEVTEGGAASGLRRIDTDDAFKRQSGRRYRNTVDGAAATNENGERVTLQVNSNGDIEVVREDGGRTLFQPQYVQMEDARFDANGKLIQATFNDYLNLPNAGRSITVRGEAALDLAIKARSIAIGEVPNAIFEEAITREEQRLVEYQRTRSDEATPTQPVVSEQGATPQSAVAEETRPTPQERSVDGKQAESAEGVVEGDTAVAGSVERVTQNIDNLIERLDQFGKETLGVNIPVALAKSALKIAKAALVAGQSVAEAVDAAIAKVKASKWYQNKTANQQAKAEQAVRDAIEKGTPLPIRTSPAQMKAIRAAKSRVAKMLNEKRVTLSAFERMALDRLNKMSLGVINQMNGEVVQAFESELNRLLDAYEASPAESVQLEVEALMDGFSDAYLETMNEANIKEGDTEDSKRKKFEEGAELAALEIEEAMEQMPDFSEIAQGYREILRAENANLPQEGIDAYIEVLRNYAVDALATLRGKTAEQLFEAFNAVYGFDFAAFGADTSSARILHELRDAAAILQTMAAGEKVPSNLQALQTAAQLVIAHEKAKGVATDYGRQKDLMALWLERIGAAFSQEAQTALPTLWAKTFFGRTARGGILMNALKYFTMYVNNVDRARTRANHKYSEKRTRLDNMLLEIKYEPSKKTPTNMSAKIARKFKKGVVEGAQLNSFTQDIFNVLSAFVLMQRMIDANPEFYTGKRKNDIRKILDAWAKTKEVDPRQDPYRPKGKRFTPVSIQERLNDELYEGVYAWLGENGFIDEDGKLDWQRALDEMSSKERVFMAEITKTLDTAKALVSEHSNAARNKDLYMFDFYIPIDKASEESGGAMLVDPSTDPYTIERELTTPEANAFAFTTQGAEDLGVKRPSVPSAANERVNKSMSRPLILSTTALILPYLRQVYRDAYITPEAQKSQKAVAFMAAMQQNADAKTQNAVRSDLRKVAGMVTEVFTPRSFRDTPETKMINRVGEKLTSQLTQIAMVAFLTRGFVVKMFADTNSDYVINLFRNGFSPLMDGFHDHNVSGDAMKWEGFIDGAGFQIVDQLGSETSQLQSAGISTGFKEFDKNRSYSKYSMQGQWLSAWNSVPVPAGRRNLYNAVSKMLGVDAVTRKGVGTSVAIMATANFANSPAALSATVKRVHKKETGRDFDINEWVDEDGKMRDLTEEQSALLNKLVQKADRAVAERSGESSPSAAPWITRKAGANPWAALLMTVFAPFMNWNYNNTQEAWRASLQVATGRKFSDKDNLFFGRDLGDGTIATMVSGANEVVARVLAALIYNGSRAYMLAMLEGALIKMIYQKMFKELVQPDDEDDEIWEDIKAIHKDEIDKIGEALPNMVRRALIETYVDGVPIFNLIPWASVLGENNLAAIPYDKEDLGRNRYLRITQGTPFKDDFDEEDGAVDAFARFLESTNPEELGRKGGSAPVFQFLNSMEYLMAYIAMDAELKRIADNLDMPTGERYLKMNVLMGMILKNPIISDFNALERKNIIEGRKKFKEFMKSEQVRMLQQQVDDLDKDFETQEFSNE